MIRRLAPQRFVQTLDSVSSLFIRICSKRRIGLVPFGHVPQASFEQFTAPGGMVEVRNHVVRERSELFLAHIRLRSLAVQAFILVVKGLIARILQATIGSHEPS